MKKLILSIIACVFASVSSFAQYSTTYQNQYGYKTGSATTTSNYGGYSTTYHDQYGYKTGSANTTTNFNGSNTTYYDKYGYKTGSSTTSNYGYGSSTTYYDQYGRTIGTSRSNWLTQDPYDINTHSRGYNLSYSQTTYFKKRWKRMTIIKTNRKRNPGWNVTCGW